MSPLQPIQLPAQIGSIARATFPGSAPPAATSFGSVMADAIRSVDGVQRDAHATVERFLAGEGEELHNVALRQQEAAITFDAFLQVRNKVVQAYQEIMRMPI